MLLKFQYDGQGRRIRKQVWNNTQGTGAPASDELFVYDGWNLLAVLNPNVRTTMIDGALFQAEVEARQVLAVPLALKGGLVGGKRLVAGEPVDFTAQVRGTPDRVLVPMVPVAPERFAVWLLFAGAFVLFAEPLIGFMGFDAQADGGEVLKPEAFNALPDADKQAIETKVGALQTELTEILEQRVPQWQKERRAALRTLASRSLPMIARATGDVTEISPRAMSASSSPTIV